MVDDKNYLLLKYLIKKFSFSENGINYEKVLSHDLGRVAFKQNTSNIFREIFFNLFVVSDYSQFREALSTYKNVCLYSIDRKDYEFQIEQTLLGVKSSKVFLLSNLRQRKLINIGVIIHSFYFTIIRLGVKKFSLSEVLFLTSRLVLYRNTYNQLSKELKSFNFQDSNVILFNSAYTLENLITQYVNTKGGKTISLSHSFFVNYRRFIPLDIINGEFNTSNKLLVWGESSKKDLVENFQYEYDKVIVAGNPKYPYKPVKLKNTFKKCLVLLGRKIYEDSNVEIINILKKCLEKDESIKFELKLHLSLDNSFYQKLCEGANISIFDGKESLVDVFKNNEFDFAIVNNSTAYYEAMYFDLICFRFLPSENEMFFGLSDYFDDADSLISKIAYFKTIDITTLNNQVEQLLKDTIGMGINRYKELIDIK